MKKGAVLVYPRLARDIVNVGKSNMALSAYSNTQLGRGV
jgi:hypothetical protein